MKALPLYLIASILIATTTATAQNDDVRPTKYSYDPPRLSIALGYATSLDNNYGSGICANAAYTFKGKTDRIYRFLISGNVTTIPVTANTFTGDDAVVSTLLTGIELQFLSDDVRPFATMLMGYSVANWGDRKRYIGATISDASSENDVSFGAAVGVHVAALATLRFEAVGTYLTGPLPTRQARVGVGIAL